jgi:hypothetical protein
LVWCCAAAALIDTLAHVPDDLDVRNETGGAVTGAVVQAGSIQQVTLTSAALPVQPQVPRQLPPRIRDFVGRVEDMAALDALLPAAHHGAVAGAVGIAAVDGLPGVGKTALAVSWAHQVQGEFPDGTLYVNLQGYGPGEPVAPGEVLHRFLRALDIVPERIPIEVEARVGLYRSMLADRRMLIVLDNASTAEQVRPLLPANQGCLVLVTSRDSLSGLVISESATRVSLAPLAPQEAVELVGGIVGSRRLEAEFDSVCELVQMCDRLPLAVRIASSRIAARPHLRIADVLAEMGHGCGRLDALSTSMDEATSVRTVFGWSYQKLTTQQARLLWSATRMMESTAHGIPRRPIGESHRPSSESYRRRANRTVRDKAWGCPGGSVRAPVTDSGRWRERVVAKSGASPALSRNCDG